MSFKIDDRHRSEGHIQPSAALVDELIHHFSRGRVVDPQDVLDVLGQTVARLSSDSCNVKDVAIPAAGQVTIIGDLHGQLPDLLTIFRLNGLPADDNVYVFNGDFVDRGSYGVEVTLLLFVCYLVNSRAVFLNRGNHECPRMNLRYHFAKEVGLKCPPHSAEVFQLFHAAFQLLPIITVVNGNIMVVHGGLYDVPAWSLDDIRTKLNRNREIPTHPPYTEEDLVLQGLLWSDPRPIRGNEQSRRGAGIHFGIELTTRWMQANNIKVLIRSHEMCEKGYDFHHELKVITVFSASRYCNKNDNFGAYLLIKPEHPLQPEIHRYRADACPGLMAEFSFPALVTDVLRQLSERIYDNRAVLEQLFAAYEEQPFISRVQWAEAMKQGLRLPDVPFLLLQKNLVPLESDGRIDWRKYLNRFQMKVQAKLVDQLASSSIWQVCQELYARSDDLKLVFQSFDANNDGVLDRPEFIGALSSLDLGISSAQIEEVFSILDRNQDGTINLEEFADTFRPLYTKITDSLTSDIHDILKDLSRLMRKQSKTVKQAFVMFDTDGSGRLSYEELVNALTSLFPDAHPPEKYLAIARFMDSDKNGSISFKEFRDAFRAISRSALQEVWTSKVVENLANLFRRNSMTLLAAFSLFDTDASGTINKSEFVMGLQLFRDILDHPLEQTHIESLWNCLDRDKNNEVDYHEFSSLFSITMS